MPDLSIWRDNTCTSIDIYTSIRALATLFTMPAILSLSLRFIWCVYFTSRTSCTIQQLSESLRVCAFFVVVVYCAGMMLKAIALLLFFFFSISLSKSVGHSDSHRPHYLVRKTQSESKWKIINTQHYYLYYCHFVIILFLWSRTCACARIRIWFVQLLYGRLPFIFCRGIFLSLFHILFALGSTALRSLVKLLAILADGRQCDAC